MANVNFAEMVRGTGVVIAFRLAGALGVYLFSVQISRFYGPSGSGLYAFVVTLATILGVLCNWGLDTYLVKFFSVHSGQKNGDRIIYSAMLQSMTLVLSCSVMILVVFSGLLPWALERWGIVEYNDELRLAGLLQMPIGLLLLLSAGYRGVRSMTMFSVLQTSLVQSVAILPLALMHSSLPSRVNPVLAYVGVGWLAVVVGLVGWRYFMFSSRSDSGGVSHNMMAPPMRSMLREAWPMLVGGVMFFVLAWSDKLMLRMLTTQSELGIFDIGYRLANLSNFGLMAIATIAAPQFAGLFATKKYEELRRHAQHTTLLGIAASVLVLVLLLCMPDFWLGLFGDGREYLPAKKVLIVLCFAQLANALCGPVLNLLNMSGFQKIARNIILSTAGINILLNALLIPLYGILGAAWATLVSSIIWNFLAYVYSYRELGFSSIPFIKIPKFEKAH